MATKALGFISIPIMTRIFSTNDYGILRVFSSYVGIFTVLFTMNAYSAVGRYFYEDEDDFKDFLGTSVILVAIVFSFFTLLLLIYREQVASLVHLPLILINYFLPFVLFNVTSSLFIQIYQPLQRSKKIAVSNVLNAYIGFALTVAFSYFIKNNKYMGQIWSQALVNMAFFVYFFLGIRTYFKFSFRAKDLKYIFSYAIPLIPYNLSGIILAQFDLMMINKYNGSSAAGLYGFAYNLGMLLSVFWGSLYKSWMPKYYLYMNSKNYTQHDLDIDKLYRIILIAAGFLVFFGREIGIILATRSYYQALNIVPPIVIGYIFFAVFYIYGRNMDYAKKTLYLTAVTLASGLLNIYLNYLFIPRYGYTAGAYTTLISYLFMAITAWICNKYILKLYSTPLIILYRPTAIFASLLVFFYLFSFLNTYFIVLIFIKLIMMFAFAWILLRGYLKEILFKS